VKDGFKSRRNHWGPALLAIGFAALPLVVGGAVLYFVLTISPVHTSPDAVPSRAAAPPSEVWSPAVEEGRRLARAMLKDENLPAVSVAVAIDGRIVWAEGFGWADVEGRVAATPLTRFRIGSVSKPLTAAAAGLLHERGLLDLDAPVQQYVPAFPEKRWPITTRQLMGDVAGVRNYPNEHERLGTDQCGTTAEAMEPFAAAPLLFRPGTQHRSSTYGWVLASAVVEAAAKEPFYGFITWQVFEPLGMNDTGPDSPAGEVPNRASFYYPRFATRTSLGLHPARPVDYSCFSGAGAFLSTPSDLVRFGSAMMNASLLRPDTIALLQTPLQLESGASTNYGLGWNVETVDLRGAPARLVGQHANPFGGTSSLITFPDHRLAIAVTSNVSYASGVARFGLKLAELFTPARHSR
jgi:serine beta-lactamase-like protein LACTB, mitochondrial